MLARDSGSLPGTRVLALGSGVTQLGVLRALGRLGAEVFPAPNPEPLCRRSRWFREPPPQFAGLRPETLAAVLERSIDGLVLLPCSDQWARAVARLPPELGRRYPASLPTPDVLEILLDKARLAELLERLKVPHPWSCLVSSERDLESIPIEVRDRSFLKPTHSHAFFARFGVKALLPRNQAELPSLLAKCREAGFRMLVQEYVPGPPSDHFFIDGFVDRAGVVRARFARRRLRMYPPDFGNSTLMVSITLEEVRDAVASLDLLLAALPYRGIFSAEFKRDQRDGIARLLEVNVRPWWYVEFAARCGVNVCALAILDALERPLPTGSLYSVGRRCVYPSYDLSAARAGPRQVGVLALARSWIGAYQPVFRWADPWPALGEVLARVRSRFG